MDYLRTHEIISTLRDAATLDNDFCIGNVETHSALTHPFTVHDYGFVICLSGEATGSIDLMPYSLRQTMMAVHIPGQLIEQHSISSDFNAIFVSMTSAFVRNMGLPYNFQFDRLVRDNPVLHLSPPHFEAMTTYCKMAKALLCANHPFRRETLCHLTCAFFYGVGSYFYQLSTRTNLTNEEDIARRFMNVLKENYKTERKVSFYAHKLSITSGYLSTIIKAVCGKSPTQLIDEFVAKEACAQLKCTSRTIQQISLDLNFASQSFFGKYFKRIVGCSPMAYRQKG